ncbi:hypothetical protein AAF712_012450 [Marasmius tenuissimus]|uniref:Uncharacterized protein n=1 Tax=Marasmius tenuissimus TaxID=585030 RepID=A0ABR2ZIG0_9AGAR
MFKGLKRAFNSVFSSGGHDTETDLPTHFHPSGKPIVAAELNIPAARADSISSKRSTPSSIIENVRKRFRRQSTSNDRTPVASHRTPPLQMNPTEVENRNLDANNHLNSNLPPPIHYPPWLFQFGSQ